MPRLRFRLLGLGLFLLVFPFFIRRRPRVERQITICAPPEEIFPMINKLQNWPLWSAWNERSEVEFSYGEIIEGEGAVQRWRGERNSGTLRILRSEPERRIDYALELHYGRFRFRIRGRLDFLQDGACTRLRWRCVWEPARNPYRRYLDLFLRWSMGHNFSRGLSNLRERVERKTARAPKSMV